MIVPILDAEPQLEEVLSQLNLLRQGMDLEIIVVADVPNPHREKETRSVLGPMVEKVSALIIYRVGERGFGSALRRGFAGASGDVMVPFMGDASDNPADIPRLMLELNRGFDVVAGSRYMKGGHIVGNTFKQQLSRLYSALIRIVGGLEIHDVSNAFKAYRRTVVESVETIAESFDISVELTIKAVQAGFRIGEIPTVWTNRRLGESKFRFPEELRRYGRWLVRAIRLRTSTKADSSPIRQGL